MGAMRAEVSGFTNSFINGMHTNQVPVEPAV
jgi:hypothetical protein